MIHHALDGVTVLDLSQGIAGPYCAALLGELGARVLKVEPPGGDWLRYAGGRIGSSTVMFESFNRGKQSIALDLKTPAGAAAARQLALRADVVVENARVGAMDRLGLGYGHLSAERPSLVYTSISGFDPQGPRAQQPATDTVMQAYAGIAQHATSVPGMPRLRIALVDIVGGLYAHQATLAALMQRWRGGACGSGQWVRIDLAHAMAALQAYKIADTLVNGPSSDLEAFAIAGNYQARDGALSISAANDTQVLAALQALGLRGLVEISDFADAPARQTHQAALRERIAQTLESMALGDALGRLQAAQVPCQPILDYAGFVADAQASSPGLFQWLRCASGAQLPAVRMPGTASTAPLPRVPSLDEHAAQLCAEFQLEYE